MLGSVGAILSGGEEEGKGGSAVNGGSVREDAWESRLSGDVGADFTGGCDGVG